MEKIVHIPNDALNIHSPNNNNSEVDSQVPILANIDMISIAQKDTTSHKQKKKQNITHYESSESSEPSDLEDELFQSKQIGKRKNASGSPQIVAGTKRKTTHTEMYEAEKEWEAEKIINHKVEKVV